MSDRPLPTSVHAALDGAITPGGLGTDLFGAAASDDTPAVEGLFPSAFDGLGDYFTGLGDAIGI